MKQRRSHVIACSVLAALLAAPPLSHGEPLSAQEEVQQLRREIEAQHKQLEAQHAGLTQEAPNVQLTFRLPIEM